MYYIQENITFHSTQAIFDEEFFPKYTNSHPKKYKLYNKLLKKISPETKSSVLGPSGKNGPAPVHIPHIYIPLIQNNSPTHFPLLFIFCKFLFLSSTPKSIIEVETFATCFINTTRRF